MDEYNVVVIPGVTALATAVAVSPMDSETFTFEGFLPMRPTRRRERLEKLKYETRLMVFYEAPHKLLNTLKDLYKFLKLSFHGFIYNLPGHPLCNYT